MQMKSMTGYGKGVTESQSRKITIEIKSVNHRYLDLTFKLPRGFSFLEDTLRKELKKRLNRGHIEIYCSYEDNREGKSSINIDSITAKQYLEIAYKLEDMGFVNDMSCSQVMHMPEVLNTKGLEDDENIIKDLAVDAANKALDKLCEMRKAEGVLLAEDIAIKLKSIGKVLSDIKIRAPLIVEQNGERLKNRIAETLDGVEVDQTKLANEIAFYSDRMAIDEEITRLESHISQAEKTLKENGTAGRKLDFLIQEMNRESNTIGSKSNDLIITQKVLELKGEIEKIREQAQNIE